MTAPSLFDAPAMEDRAALKLYLQHHARRLAIQLAERNGGYGVTASDVRVQGQREGLWTHGQFHDRTWSFLSHTFRAVGLVPNGRQRRSDVPGARNYNRVYVLPPRAGE